MWEDRGREGTGEKVGAVKIWKTGEEKGLVSKWGREDMGRLGKSQGTGEQVGTVKIWED